jgi:L-lactate dehydrogenase complex protein LldG
MKARDEILTALRASGDARVDLPELRSPTGGSEDLIARFVERASNVGIQVVRAPEQTWVASAVSELGRRNARSVAIWADPLIMPLATALQTHGIDVVRPDQHTTDRLAHVDAGVTTADYAIALSGTLLLTCDALRPRATSLLPPLHIAVVPETRIVPSLAHVFGQLAPPLASAVTFITGPSRSADIEHTPVKGAHGPVEVIVYLIMGLG